ncbi:MAG: SPOR domain-containing protein [Pseudohongiellaceae bacterium]
MNPGILFSLVTRAIIWPLAIVLSVMTPAAANSVENALSASQQGDYASAVSQLKSLAENGNTLAQYNLALFYKNGTGVATNAQLAEYWFEQAARSRMIEAYGQLRSTAIRPGQRQQVNLVFGPQEWIRVQDPGNYTLQLASSRNSRLIKRYYSEYQLQGRGGYFLNTNRNHYALVFGAYPSVADATEAIKELPEELRQWQPWVRQLRQIQARMANE